MKHLKTTALLLFISILSTTNAFAEGCFEYVYPLSFDMEDGTVLEVADEATMITTKKDWSSKGLKPTLKFPIKVKWEGKPEMEIADQATLDRHYTRCKAKYKTEKCFDLIYPVKVQFADGTTEEVASKEEMKTKRAAWGASRTRASLVYPVEVKWEGKDPIKVNNETEMSKMHAYCK